MALYTPTEGKRGRKQERERKRKLRVEGTWGTMLLLNDGVTRVCVCVWQTIKYLHTHSPWMLTKCAWKTLSLAMCACVCVQGRASNKSRSRRKRSTRKSRHSAAVCVCCTVAQTSLALIRYSCFILRCVFGLHLTVNGSSKGRGGEACLYSIWIARHLHLNAYCSTK